MHRAVDPGKDQSYVLGVLTQEQLAHSLFPLGDSPKAEVRDGGGAARPAGRRQARQPRHLLHLRRRHRRLAAREARARSAAATIVDARRARCSARHDGRLRRSRSASAGGCGSGRPAADGKPRYVLDIEPVSGTVTVGPREELAVDRLDGHPAALVRRRPRRAAATCTVQLRAHGDEHRAVVTGRSGDEVEVELLDPAQGIAPGQAAVVYDGTRVVGSCTIASTSPDAGPTA